MDFLFSGSILCIVIIYLYVFVFRYVKQIIIKKLASHCIKNDTHVEISDNFFLVTFSNGESIIAPYNEDLIYDERKVAIDINGKTKKIKLKRGFDLSKLNL